MQTVVPIEATSWSLNLSRIEIKWCLAARRTNSKLLDEELQVWHSYPGPMIHSNNHPNYTHSIYASQHHSVESAAFSVIASGNPHSLIYFAISPHRPRAGAGGRRAIIPRRSSRGTRLAGERVWPGRAASRPGATPPNVERCSASRRHRAPLRPYPPPPFHTSRLGE